MDIGRLIKCICVKKKYLLNLAIELIVLLAISYFVFDDEIFKKGSKIKIEPIND